MSDLNPGEVKIGVHGPAVAIEDAIEVGQATKTLLEEIAHEISGRDLKWRIKSVQFQCDGCGLVRPDRPGPDEGWTYHEGDDLCPVCTADLAAEVEAIKARETAQ